ncbi:hypothetical protein IW148_003232 [Coemansia sp. RSA 1199]|nr:hypothetical protein IW148_003232 [Coemansia sp. RSA 1199]
MYKNNIKLRFGETWSRAINLKLDSKRRRKALEQELGDQKKSKAFIRQQVQEQIWSPARRTKQILHTRHPKGTTDVEKDIVNFLSLVLSCYPTDYAFEDDSIYLDAELHPERHLMAFITLNKCLAAAEYRCIQSLPLQRSWIHRHVPLDTRILAQQILKDTYSPGSDEEYWAKVIDLKLRVFKDHPRHTFNKFITTDGVSLSVVRRTVEATLAKQAAGEKRKLNQLAKQAQQTAQQAQLPEQSVQPAHSTAQPAYSTTVQPAHSTTQPAHSTLQPAYSMTQPAYSTTTQPVYSTMTQPAYSTTTQPAYSTTMQSAVQAAVQPAYSTTQPVYSTTQPVFSFPLSAHSFPLSAHSFPLLAQSTVYLTTQPPVRLPMVVPAQQAWVPMVVPAQQAWVPMVVPVQQAWVPIVTPMQQEWTVMDQPAQPSGKPAKRQRKKADCLYIDELSQEYLQSTAGRCVLVDPGRRDLLFAMREDSTIQKKQIFRYTKCQQRRETCVVKYRKILEQVKKADKEDIAALERKLGAGSFIKPDLALFKEYLRARAKVEAKLTRFYNKTMSWQQDGATRLAVPLHRKLRFGVYIRRQQADGRLVKKLREKFKPEKTDPEPLFIMGDWSAPMTKFHEPIRGKGWRRLLKRAGFEVYLIDEYLTSKLCPNCNERLSNTHKVPNPRPWMRSKKPKVNCHGLLSCESRACVEFFDTYERGYLREKGSDVKRRLWNRDLVGVLNFRHILNSLRETGIAPARFKRGQPAEASTAPKPNKARKTTTSTACKPRKTTARKTTAPTASPANST